MSETERLTKAIRELTSVIKHLGIRIESISVPIVTEAERRELAAEPAPIPECVFCDACNKCITCGVCSCTQEIEQLD